MSQTYRIGTLNFTGSQAVLSSSLDVSGSGRFTNGLTVTGSFTVITGSSREFQVRNIGVDIGNAITDRHTITGSIDISGSLKATSLTSSALLVSGSGSVIISAIGSQGTLLNITDSLSGSLFVVSDQNGYPVLEAFSDSRVLIGSYEAPALNTTVLLPTTAVGANVIYGVPTGSYNAVFVDYYIVNGAVSRAGRFTTTWSGSQTNFTDITGSSFGNSSGFTFGSNISGSLLIISGSSNTADWRVKTIIKSI